MRAAGRLLYALVIGDDWRIAAGTAASVAVGLALLLLSAPALVVALITAALLGATLVTALVLDTRTGPR